MDRLAAALLFSAMGLGLGLRLPVVDQACALHSFPADGSLVDVMAFGDASLEDSPNATAASDAQTEYNNAKKEYVSAKTQMRAAEGRLMKAMDGLLTVPATDGNAVSELMAKKEKDAFVVFYAPWCPHCQSFVLHDGKGDPTKAPLELIKKDLAADPASKDVEVLRFDVNVHRDIPKGLDVEFIPTMYVLAGGKATKFEGNPKDSAALKAFITEHKSKKA